MDDVYHFEVDVGACSRSISILFGFQLVLGWGSIWVHAPSVMVQPASYGQSEQIEIEIPVISPREMTRDLGFEAQIVLATFWPWLAEI